MEELTARIRAVEVKIEQLRKDMESVNQELKNKTDEDAVKVIVDESMKVKKVVTDSEVVMIVEKTLDEKNMMSESDVKMLTNDTHLTIIKWVIGTAISVGALTTALLRLFA